jgi:pimeloyl-ACP methyl ester carboxylesterase
MNHKRAVETGYFNSFDGTKIYFEERGEGKETILFMYGIACIINHLHFQLDYFSVHYRVFILDYRGHGLSDKPKSSENINISSLIMDQKQLLDLKKVTKVHLVGHSYGCQVATEFLKKYPTCVQTITLLNGYNKSPFSSGFFSPFVKSTFSFIEKNYKKYPELCSSLWKNIIDNPATVLITGAMGGFNLNISQYKDIEIYTRGVSLLSLEVFLALFFELLNYDDNLIHNSKIPALLISGEFDFVTPYHLQVGLQKKFKNSSLIVIKKGTHCSQLDCPHDVNLAIEKFLQLSKS